MHLDCTVRAEEKSWDLRPPGHISQYARDEKSAGLHWRARAGARQLRLVARQPRMCSRTRCLFTSPDYLLTDLLDSRDLALNSLTSGVVLGVSIQSR